MLSNADKGNWLLGSGLSKLFDDDEKKSMFRGGDEAPSYTRPCLHDMQCRLLQLEEGPYSSNAAPGHLLGRQ